MTFTPPDAPSVGQDTLRQPSADPAAFSVLSIAKPLPVNPQMGRAVDGLPEKGVRFDHQRCVQSDTWPNCPPDPEALMDVSPEDDTGHAFFPVTWYVPVGCDNTPANRQQFEQWRALAEEDVVAASAFQMSQFILANASLTDVQGEGTVMPSLGAVAEVVGDPDVAVNPRDGLAHLLQDYRTCNEAAGQAVVWIPDSIEPYLSSWTVLRESGSKLRTSGGVDVAVIPGDERWGPFENEVGEGTGEVVPADEGETWIYVSGPIFAALGSPYTTADPSGRLRASGVMVEGYADPRTNRQDVIVARRGLFMFDTCCVRAIKVRIVNVPSEAG